jgi:hypothetical protein
MHHYCTLFDKNYLIYGLALHSSLLRQSKAPFRLYMLAMDETAEAALRKLQLENVVVVGLRDVLAPELAWVHERMTFGQICWTSQPLLCKHVLDRHGADEVTYLEADSFFFADPQLLFDEVGTRSVSLVPHNYAPEYDQTAESGVFCVQFNLFRNDAPGRELLAVWEAACLRYDKKAAGYYPGQLCMDEWPARSTAVCVVRHKGAGVAPWNVSRFRVALRDGAPTVDDVPVVFFHFHELAFMEEGRLFLSSYRLGAAAKELIYAPYVAELARLRGHLRSALPGYDHCKTFRSPGLWRALTSLKRAPMRGYLKYLYLRTKGRRNVVSLAERR